jgi:type IV secretion system protein VirD4
VTFATNDERTAKRISETLGTATELRAQRNYAGHRLAPWLGHLMVSRQETARPLLTPGEVMQLPPDEAVVMVSSVAPIKAKKLRYYADANFKRRVLPPPALADGQYADAPPSRPTTGAGWRFPPCPPHRPRHPPMAAENLAPPTTAARAVSPSSPKPSPTTPSWPRPQPTSALLDDDDDLPLPLPRQLDPAMQRTARLASLDPNDGIEL